MEYPEGLKYSKEHEWVLVEGTTATIGITIRPVNRRYCLRRKPEVEKASKIRWAVEVVALPPMSRPVAARFSKE
jgi:hypothetical protein